MESLRTWFVKNLFAAKNGSDGSSQNKPYVITVIGSGGKTSLIWQLAQNLPAQLLTAELSAGRLDAAGVLPRILVTPTTKMFVPPKEAGLYDYYFGGGISDIYSITNPAPGVTLAGKFNTETGKLEALPDDALEKIAGNYDYVLIEGDGSRGLPLKAWAEHEPVIPSFTTATIGIIPIKAVGMTVSEKTVLRLPLFTQLTGAKEGDTTNLETLVQVITGTVMTVTTGTATPGITGADKARGLFDAAIGRRILFINQVETEAEREQARKLASLLPQEFSPGLFKIIAGSVKNDCVIQLK